MIPIVYNQILQSHILFYPRFQCRYFLIQMLNVQFFGQNPVVMSWLDEYELSVLHPIYKTYIGFTFVE